MAKSSALPASAGETFSDAVSAFLVGSALTLNKVRLSVLAFLGYPFIILLLGHVAVGRDVAGVKHVVDERRLAPIAGKEEIVVGAQDAGFSHSLLLVSRLRILEMVENEIVGID